MKKTFSKLTAKASAICLTALFSLTLISFTSSTEWTQSCDKSNSNRCSWWQAGIYMNSTGALTVVIP